MAKYLFKHITGIYILNDSGEVVEYSPFTEKEDFDKPTPEKFQDLKTIDKPHQQVISEALTKIKKDLNPELVRAANLKLTKNSIKQSVSKSLLIIQCISAIEDFDRIISTLSTRMREWFAYYLPEYERIHEDNEKLANAIINLSRKEMLDEISLDEENTMGSPLEEKDYLPIKKQASYILELLKLRKENTDYLEGVVQEACPNLYSIAGAQLGAKLIALSGDLERLSLFPASTIQLLGAEKALFRHMKTGAKSPKHGIIIQHPIVQKAGQKHKGKAARAVADSISIASKVDFFRGNFVGDTLKDKLEKKFVN